MSRNLRRKRNQSIIELSDSENEYYKTTETIDNCYVIEKSKTRKAIGANDERLPKKTAKPSARNEGVKSSKRKLKSPLETYVSKRRKLSVSSSDVSFDEEGSQRERREITKDGIKRNISLDRRLNSNFTQHAEWTDIDYISEINNVDRHIVENVVKLFREDNTIPFIARYRKNLTGSMEADQLRVLKDSFDRANIIKHRAAAIIRSIDKIGKWSPEIYSAVTSAKSIADLECIYSLFKPTLKRSLAERARELGLGDISDAVLRGQSIPPLVSLIDEQREGLRTVEQVKDGIVRIIADTVSKDKEVYDKVISLWKTSVLEIRTMRCKPTKSSKECSKNAIDEHKYEMYFDFRANERNIKPHQILAINRAESRKILSVKIIIPDAFERALKTYCSRRYASAARVDKLHEELLEDSIDYAYKKLIKPLVVRRVRAEMKEKAEVASIEVFATNVKQLLLIPPVRGKVTLGIDPGFHHGCKLAVVSAHGDLLDTAVIYPHKNSETFYEESVHVLVKLVNKYRCTILALGNATACRETELFLTKVIKSKAFGSLDVAYTIVDEAGASVYSCSPEAKSEFPNLDSNLVSAVSIARRLQDPLAELVKVEPKHLGVGMYQHDLPEKRLLAALDEVIVEAVSFVGVDVNTASRCLLRRVAGLTNSRAANIVEWRTKHGVFKNREQLLKVKSIGSKTFEQCAGFIRILPETAVIDENPTRGKKSICSTSCLNPLDQTWIHPESYAIANKLLKHCQCDSSDLGTPAFIERISLYARAGYAELAARFDTNESAIEIIVKGLIMRKDEDIRLKSNYPLFHNGIRSIDDLSIGTILNGVVRNITHFGAFIDVGVGRDGLMHITNMRNQTVCVGQRLEVKILFVEHVRNRIGLELVRIL